MEWYKITMAVCTLLTIQGGLFVAAAKSIFITKKLFYDSHGVTIFLPRVEYENTIVYRDRRQDGDINKINHSIEKILSTIVPRHEIEKTITEIELRHSITQQNLCDKIEQLVISTVDLQKSQNEINQSLMELKILLKGRS